LRYPPEFVDRVQDANNLADIISQYTQLKQSGNGYMGRCPFPDHAEKTPSFSVSEAKQVYHCFGCKKSGNVFSFLRDYNGMSFPEAVEFLAERASIPLPEIKNEQQNEQYSEQQDKKKQMLKANKVAAHFFSETLKRAPADHPIKAYIQKRKLQPETIEEFQIGYAPIEWEGLAHHLLKQNISTALAEEVRLIKARKENNGHFDIFRDRLMFPILSPMQEVLAFGGRIHDQGEPKYLNSPETPVFNKSKVLYGLAHTAKYIRSEDAVIIVEGYMDLVSLFQAGLKNVAASMGTALTAEHAKLIKRLTTNVVVLFDSDEAGQRAAERSLPLLLAAGLYPKGLILTDAKDPDEYVTKFGMESLKQKIDTSPELFNMVLQMWMSDYKWEA
jgi:DNA primase